MTARVHMELGPPDQAGQDSAVRRGNERVVVAGEHQRWLAQQRQERNARPSPRREDLVRVPLLLGAVAKPAISDANGAGSVRTLPP